MPALPTRCLVSLAACLGGLLMVGCSSTPAPRASRSGLAAEATPAPAAPTGAAPMAGLRARFLTELQRAQQGLPVPPDPPSLQRYALYEYLLAARLQRALQVSADAALDARIDAFLSAHLGEPVTHDLRHDWLVSLAARGRWDWFLPRATAVSDPLLICQRLAGHLAGVAPGGDTASLTTEALAVWGEPVQQPSACDGIFEWLQQQGLLTPDRLEGRIRAALTAGNVPLALQLAAALPPARSAPLLLWARLLQAPAVTLQTLTRRMQATPVEPAALEAGFHRLSLRNSAAAAALLPKLLARPGMTPLLQGQLRRDAALGLSYDHDPAALALFASLPQALADERVQQWRVRTALWAGDRAQALAWLRLMPATLAAQPRWQYWRARTTEAIDGLAAAVPLYAAVATSRDYYGYLAADRLHRPYDLQDHATAQDPAAQTALAARPALVRAHELLVCGLYDDAVAEWAVGLAGTTPEVQVQAAHLADHWGWYAQSIATLAQAGAWDDVRLRYPRPFAPQVQAASARAGLPADWILAVMRQESLFRADAVSRADARGLMQLQPSTARRVAQRWQLAAGAATLFDPATAVTLGAAHLRDLLDRFGGQLAPALAAYNAGTTALTRWLPAAPMAPDIWIENIPYDETRGYVEHILEHIVAYAFTRDAEPPRLAALLPPIAPSAAYAVQAAAPATPGAPLPLLPGAQPVLP